MAMNDYKITQEQLANRRVQDAPDQPQGTAQQVKALFDNIALNVVIPAFNALVDALGGEQAAGMTGAQPIEGLDGVTVQALLQSLKELCDSIIQTADNDRVYAQQIENTANQHYANEDNPHNVTKEQVGLGNCDNTADLDKPVSQAQKAYTDQIVAGAMMGTIPDNSLQLIKLVPEVQRLIEYAIQPSGGTMIGNIKMTQGATVTGLPNPTGDTDAVSKAYLIAQFATRLAGYLSVSGGTMTGAINMDNKKIINLPVPSASKDAATKEYVDKTTQDTGVIGTYIGNGENGVQSEQFVSLGFTPRAVFAIAKGFAIRYNDWAWNYFAFATTGSDNGTLGNSGIYIKDGGFIATWNGQTNNNYGSNVMNKKGSSYHYFAVK